MDKKVIQIARIAYKCNNQTKINHFINKECKVNQGKEVINYQKLKQSKEKEKKLIIFIWLKRVILIITNNNNNPTIKDYFS